MHLGRLIFRKRWTLAGAKNSRPNPNQMFTSHRTYNYIRKNHLLITSCERVMITSTNYNNRPNHPAIAIWF